MGTPVFIAITAETMLAQNVDTSFAVPAGAAIGDLLLVHVVVDSSDTWDLTLPVGWTLVRRNPSNLFRGSHLVAFAIHDGSASYVFRSLHRGSRGRMLCYRDIDGAPITSSDIKMLSGASISTNPITVSAANSLEVVFVYQVDTGNSTITAASGMTSRANKATYPSISIADATVTPTTTPVRTITQTLTNQISVINLVIAGTGGGSTTPITFTGTIPAQSATVGALLSLDVASYFSGTQTPFTYAIQSGTLPDGLSLSGSTISGTPTTAAGAVSVVVRGTDADLATADSNSFTITVAAAGSPPSGTFTIGTPTVTQTTASVPYTYSAADATAIRYTLNGGTTTFTASTSPQSLTGLTPNTDYSIQFRAVNSAGSGNWSAVRTFKTAAVPPPQPTGTQAQNIPSTGTHGPALLYKDIALVGAQPTDLMRAEIVVPPSVGTLTMNANSSFTYTGPSTTFTYEGFINDVSYGTGVVTLTTGG